MKIYQLKNELKWLNLSKSRRKIGLKERLKYHIRKKNNEESTDDESEEEITSDEPDNKTDMDRTDDEGRKSEGEHDEKRIRRRNT